jgi:regulator of nucleoside diphosphate kinase
MRPARASHFDALENELARAIVVPTEQIPKAIVTMNSYVVFEDETEGKQREVTLAYPAHTDISVARFRS